MCFTNMIFLPSLFNGIEQSITKQLVDYEVGNVLVSPKSGDQYVNDLDATLDLINGMPGVERATPHYTEGATFTYRQRILGVSVRAIMPEDEKYVSPLYTKMIAGDYLGESDTGRDHHRETRGGRCQPSGRKTSSSPRSAGSGSGTRSRSRTRMVTRGTTG